MKQINDKEIIVFKDLIQILVKVSHVIGHTSLKHFASVDENLI